jgi:hypothetical protein
MIPHDPCRVLLHLFRCRHGVNSDGNLEIEATKTMIMMTIPRVGDGHLEIEATKRTMMTITKMQVTGFRVKYLHGFNGMRRKKMTRKRRPPVVDVKRRDLIRRRRRHPLSRSWTFSLV